MSTVTFNGSVSAQAQADETVTITVTLPSGITETLTAKTLADKTFTVSNTYAVAGNYSAKASVGEDAQYQGATSPVATFTIGLTPRNITLTVTVA